MRFAGSERALPSRLIRVGIIAMVAMALFARLGYGLDPDRSISQYAHSAWRLRDGFIGATPNDITQTTDGYMWIGTESGIVRFDGVRFVPWAPPEAPQLRSLTVLKVLGTSDGSLWISAVNGGLYQWRNERLTTYIVPGNDLISALLEKEKGKIWFTRWTPQNDSMPVCEAGDGRVQCYRLKKEIAAECCQSLVEGEHGDLWLGGTSLIRWRAGTSTADTIRIPAARPEEEGVVSMAALPNGSLWIGVATPGKVGGLQHYEKSAWSHFNARSWDSSRVGVRSVLFDSHGALWVGTVDQGVYRIRDGRVDHYGSKDGLSDDKVMSLFEDHEGNLWVSTRKGVDSFRDIAVTSYSVREGLKATEFDTVLATRDGNLWTGGGGSLDQMRGGTYIASLTGKSLPGGQVTSLFEDSHGNMLVGIDQTLSILRGRKFSEIRRPDGKSLGMVTGITEDLGGTIWAEVLAKPRQLVEIADRKVVHMFPTPDVPAARKVAAGTHGELWLGLGDGSLARYQKGKLDFYRFSDKKDLWVKEVGVESDGTVLGATGYGLVGWRDGEQRVLNTHNGLPCDGVNSFIRDNENALWLHTQCGLIRLSAKEVDAWWKNPDTFLKIRLFDSADGMEPALAPFQKAARTPDGKLWFVNETALQMIDPSHLPVNAVIPPVHVEELVVAGRSFSPTLSMRLARSTRDLSIRYTALSYVAPQKVIFRYMLEGQDHSWQEAGSRREAFYTNLRPGSYRFHVIACNNQGLWNIVGDSLTFAIPPAFYQTQWFAAVCILSLAGVLWILYLVRLRQVTSQLQGRLGARMEERERIARELHDTLLQGFQGLVLRFQAVVKTLPNDQVAHEMMEKALDRADEVLLEGRQSVKDLRTVGGAGLELSDALSRCGEDLALGHPTRFSLVETGHPRFVKPVVADEAYRIVREALINAFQHSEASQIEAEITFHDAWIRIIVRDDGKGIDEDTVARGREGHWGLSGMRERASKIGAKMAIWSNPGAGTEVQLTIPAEVAYSGNHTQTLWQRIKLKLGRTKETKQ